MKELPKSGFKAHQGFASKIISNYAKKHRAVVLERKRILELEGKEL